MIMIIIVWNFQRNSLHAVSPPSPKGYYETDIIPIKSVETDIIPIKTAETDIIKTAEVDIVPTVTAQDSEKENLTDKM